MIINCKIASNVPEYLDEMKKALEDIFGVKFEVKTIDDSVHHCKCGKNCCKHQSEFDNVEQIEHID